MGGAGLDSARRPLAAAVCCLCLAVSGGRPPSAWAGTDAGPDRSRPPSGPMQAPRLSRIELPLHADAPGRLDAAERLVGQGRWGDAIAVLQRLLEEPGDGLVWAGRAYVPASRAAEGRIAAMPPEGLRAYRLLYEPAARELYERGIAERSEDALRRAASLYLNTEHGLRSLSALAAMLMDRGRFGAALLALRRSGALPLEPAARAPLAARELVCLARLGKRSEAERLVRSLRAAGVESIRLAGREWSLPELVDRAFAELAPAGTGATGQAPWHVPERPVAVPVDIPWSAGPGPGCPSLASARTVVGGDLVFIKHANTVTACEQGSMRLRWQALPPGALRDGLWAILSGQGPDREPLPPGWGVGDGRRWLSYDNHGLSTLSFDGRRLLAVQVDFAALGYPRELWTARPEDLLFGNQLRCYDAASGRLLWSSGGAGPLRGAALGGFWFYTAPTVRQGRAYVLAVKDGWLHALCIRAASGGLVWDSTVGGFESRRQPLRYCMEFFLGDASPPAVSEGVAVFPTGQGVVAAFDALGGTPLWTATYPESVRQVHRLGQQLKVPGSSWLPGRPVLADGLCILTPRDSRHVVALSLATGAVAWRAEVPHGVALLGERSGELYVQDDGVRCIRAASGTMKWRTGLPEPPVGLGVLSGDGALVPAGDGVWLVDWAGQARRLAEWPEPAPRHANLVVVPGGLLAVTPDGPVEVTDARRVLATARADAADGPGAAGALLRRGMALARVGDPRQAAADLEQAARLAASDAEAASLGRVRRAAVGALARLAAREGDPELLARAAGLAGDHPALRAPLAVARLRVDLGGDSAAATYFRLCREAGMIRVRRGGARANLWPELARIVRAARPPGWQAQVSGLIEQAADRSDVEALLDIARFAPFRAGRASALLALGRAWEASGRREPARRAFVAAAIVASHDATRTEAGEAARRLGGDVPGSGLRGVAPGAGPLAAMPAESVAWSHSGVLLTPVSPAPAWFQDRVLALDGDALVCLRAEDGHVVWTLPVPAEAKRPAARGSPNMVAWCPLAPVSVAVLPGGIYGFRPADGKPVWRLAQVSGPAGRGSVVPSVPRAKLIRLARRGLDVEEPAASRAEPASLALAVTPLAAAIAVPGDGVVALEPPSGRPLVALDPGPVTLRDGPAFGLTRAGLWAVRRASEGARLEVHDLVDGSRAAEWVFPRLPFVRSVASGPSGLVCVADRRTARTVDLDTMSAGPPIAVGGGIERVLLAGRDLVLIVTADGRLAGIDPRSGGQAFELRDVGRAVWAARAGEALYVLGAGRLRGRVPWGPEVHFAGSGFVLCALRASDGGELWRRAWPSPEEQLIGPPLRCGSLWLVRRAEPEKVSIEGLRADNGEQAFALELAGPAEANPVSLQVAGGRLLAGVGGRTVALRSETDVNFPDD